MSVELEISHQGAPIVNHTHMVRAASDVIAFHIDMQSKRCNVTCAGSDADNVPVVMISANEYSSNLDGTKNRNEMTEVRFPQYPGWSVHSTGSGRYTISVCLTKNLEPESGEQQ